MKAKNLLILILLIHLFNAMILSQEKWNQDPRMTAIYPSGQYVPLPQYKDNFVNPNTKVRVVQTPMGTLLVNPTFRIHPTTTTTQSEVMICRNPLNQNIFFGSANTAWPPNGFTGISEGVYVTTNGGVSWFGWDSVHSPVLYGHGGDDGPTIDKNGTFIISHLGYPASGMFANYSTDFGATFSATYTIAGGSQDKNFSGTDDAPSSPYYGRSYTVWSYFSFSSPPIAISYTTNGGVSWSSYIQVNTPPSGHYSQGVDMRCGPNGEVYLAWAAPMTSGTYTEDFDGFAKSTNGGVNWTVTENAFDANGIRGYLPTKANIRVNSFPRIDVDRSGGPRNGWIYVVGCDKNLSPAGSDPDVILHRSTDGGVTWSSGIRVNQDALNNGAIQYFPAIRVDEYGGINIVYYDDRSVGSNLVQVYVSRSIDGGNTWTDVQVSDHNFAPSPIPGLADGYQGDYIGISSGNNKVWPLWMSNFSGFYQAWTTSIVLGPSINYTPLGNTENTTGPYVVNCTINAAGSPIDPSKTRLFWSRNNPAITDSLLLTNTSGNNWTASIPGNGQPALYRYYLRTADVQNWAATSPPGAPGNLYSFLAIRDTSKPFISYTPLADMPRNLWPATVSAVVTDYIGIDSVWVQWYKNTTQTGWKFFRLNTVEGSDFSSLFNSDTSFVACNDSIFYKIIAQDNSISHNRDSTELLHFKLLNVVNSCIGTGNVPVTWPYNTIRNGSKTDILFTANEIISSGGGSGIITKIGLDVVETSLQSLNGFTIKMQNSVSNSVNGFAQSGWTTVFSTTYAVQGTGWQFIDLQAPFFWNSAQNLLIEICFDNSSFSPASPIKVYATNVNGMTWTQDQGNQNGCSFSEGSLQSARPNICMQINLTTGIEGSRKNIPDIFSLMQNYPNPFNPTTNIKFSLPNSGFVRLEVYDILGRLIKTLVNEPRVAGIYEVTFDGSMFASGVYLYRILAGKYTDVKKMVLVK